MHESAINQTLRRLNYVSIRWRKIWLKFKSFPVAMKTFEGIGNTEIWDRREWYCHNLGLPLLHLLLLFLLLLLLQCLGTITLFSKSPGILDKYTPFFQVQKLGFFVRFKAQYYLRLYFNIPLYQKSIRPYFFAKTWWISMKRACMRQPWTLICMRKLFSCLSIASVDGKQHLSEIVFSALVEFSLLEKYPAFRRE